MVDGLNNPGILFPEGLLLHSPLEKHRWPSLRNKVPCCFSAPAERTWKKSRLYFSPAGDQLVWGLPWTQRVFFPDFYYRRGPQSLSCPQLVPTEQLSRLNPGTKSVSQRAAPGPQLPSLRHWLHLAVLPCPLVWKEGGSVPSYLLLTELGLWLSPSLNTNLLFFFLTVREPAWEECVAHSNEERGEQRWLKLKIIFSPVIYRVLLESCPIGDFISKCILVNCKPGGPSLVICSALCEPGFCPCLQSREVSSCKGASSLLRWAKWMLRRERAERRRRGEAGTEKGGSTQARLGAELSKVDSSHSGLSLLVSKSES